MKKPLIMGHRGFSGKYPENSPLAFKKLYEETDADGLESDVHVTKDGVMVIMHDNEVDRTSNGKGLIKDLTYDEMKALDIGAWKSPEYAGEHIWTFEELLDFCKETKLLLNIELKNYDVFYDGLEQRVIDAITQRKMVDQVFVSSFNHVSMQKFKSLNTEIKMGLLHEPPLIDMPEYLKKAKADNVHPKYTCMQWQPELIDIYHSMGIGINVWTVNERADMEDMIKKGIDGIISNWPDELCRAVKDLCD